MIINKYKDIAIALAGVFQSAHLVKQAATTEKIDEHAFSSSIQSLLVTDPKNTIDVYSDISNLRRGFRELLSFFTSDRDQDICRYAMYLVFFEKKLSTNKDFIQLISRRINIAISQARHFSITHENVIASLADIYSSTFGTLNQRIQILGDEIYLTQADRMNKIRALLLAGIRSAVLWRQVGGKRSQFILSKKRIKQALHQTLKEESLYVL